MSKKNLSNAYKFTSGLKVAAPNQNEAVITQIETCKNSNKFSTRYCLNFDAIVSIKIMDYYEIEVENALLDSKKNVKIRLEDIHLLRFEKNDFNSFIIYILEKLEIGKNLDAKAKEDFVQNRLNYPGEFQVET
jgi:hypothetical protein